LGRYDWLVLTSPNGVDFFFSRLKSGGKDARNLAGLRIAAIGPATAEKLDAYGLRADLIPDEYVAEGLIRALKETGVAGRKILLARAAEARAVLKEELAAAGAEVHEAALYRTLPPEDLTPEAWEALAEKTIDLVTFTSSSTVTNLVRLLGDRLPGFQSAAKAACIGPITAQTARAAGFEVAVEALEYTVDGLVAAVLDHLAS
jgi:uroporphyrinogen III methyltransferase/synthase